MQQTHVRECAKLSRMAVAVTSDEVELVTTFGSSCGVDVASKRAAFMQILSLRHAVDFSLLSFVAAMLNDELTECPVDLAVQRVSNFLHFEAKMTWPEAKEHIRVAHALDALPQTAEAFGEGVISWVQLRLLTQFVTPENEADVLAKLDSFTLNWLKNEAAKAKAQKDAEDETPKIANTVRYITKNGRPQIIVDSDDVTDALIRAAIDRLADVEGIDPETETYRPRHPWHPARRAVAEDPGPDAT